jgi:hypothetical protein
VIPAHLAKLGPPPLASKHGVLPRAKHSTGHELSRIMQLPCWNRRLGLTRRDRVPRHRPARRPIVQGCAPWFSASKVCVDRSFQRSSVSR